jgi:cytochrome c-type biogenesis protein
MPPLVIAVVAGGLSVTNPCGFALMPAFLSLYISAEDQRLPSASSRVAQGFIVGAAVSLGMILVLAVVGLPIVYGAVRFTRAIPWAGLAVGMVLAIVGIGLLAGRHIALSLRSPVRVQQDRSIRTMVVFGGGYGIASLGCTLPVFLATVGASLATRGGLPALAVLTAYAAGMFVVVMALALGAALARHGLQQVEHSEAEMLNEHRQVVPN